MKIRIVAIAIFMFSAFSINSAQSFEKKSYDLGISIGNWFEGDVYVYNDDRDLVFSKEGSLLIRAFYDCYLIPKLSVGLYFNFASISFSDAASEPDMFEFGFTIKPRFFLSRDVAIKPGLNIGYRSVSSDFETTEHDAMGLNLSIELQYYINKSVKIVFLDTGFLAQPIGGNDDFTIDYDPIFYVGLGVAL